MYDLIFEYLRDNLFNSQSLTQYSFSLLGQNTTLQSWLCHTVSIFCIGLIIFVLIFFIKWLFKLFGGLITLR